MEPREHREIWNDEFGWFNKETSRVIGKVTMSIETHSVIGTNLADDAILGRLWLHDIKLIFPITTK